VTSERKIRANRANARASTGPKTPRGRTHAARNALRHALSLPVHSDPALSKEVEALAQKIVGTDKNLEKKELARRIAEAHIDLGRIRYARHRFLSRALDDPNYESEARRRKKLTMAIRYLDRYVAGKLSQHAIESIESLDLKPEGPYKFATILADKAGKLLALDRYERRARSRRKSAIRAFDAARAANDELSDIPSVFGKVH